MYLVLVMRSFDFGCLTLAFKFTINTMGVLREQKLILIWLNMCEDVNLSTKFNFIPLVFDFLNRLLTIYVMIAIAHSINNYMNAEDYGSANYSLLQLSVNICNLITNASFGFRKNLVRQVCDDVQCIIQESNDHKIISQQIFIFIFPVICRS